MIQTGIEPKVKVQQIIENQLPEYVLSESPRAVDFLKQYYISQEYQGGNIDISDNLDQYLKLDNLTPDVVVGSTTLSTGISTDSDTIPVSSTKGFPNEWGLLKINDEIITYTGVTTNSFTGVKRGFSGITSYHQELNQEELTFSTSSTADHLSGSYVQNLSSLFLQEFYKKLKYSLTPGLENVDFDPNLNAGTFIKEARALYNAKGTDESFRILFNALYNETPKVVNLEEYLLKPSAANYVRREVVIAEALSGDVTKLAGQTLFKTSDVNTSASISEVEGFSRVGVALTTIQNYYKLSLFIGFDDSDSTIQGDFDITQATRCLDNVSIGSSVLSVDSTVGFGQTGTIISLGNTSINYTSKSVNQFFGCTGIGVSIKKSDEIRSNNTYYGYEDGDSTKKVELRLTGVLSDFEQVSTNLNINEGETISVKNVGDFIQNPATNATFKQVFANSWIYNTSCRYFLEGQTFNSASTFTTKSKIDRSSLKKGDIVEVVRNRSNNVVAFNNGVLESSILQITGDNTVQLSDSLSVEGAIDLRRKLNYAKSTAVPLEVDNIITDTSNLYIKDETEAYYAANSLPSGRTGVTTDFLNVITTDVKSATATGLDSLVPNTLDQYSVVSFGEPVPFFTGDEIYYKPSGTHYVGLETGRYYCEIVSSDKKKIRVYGSRASIESATYIPLKSVAGDHKFILNSQRSEEIAAQKTLKKFPLTSSSNRANQTLTEPGATGMLINGVEITNYKSEDKVYYGPLKSATVVTSGNNYDVVRPPNIHISSGVGTDALVQPVVQGSVTKVFIDPQGFDITEVQSIDVVGGNGTAVLEPIIILKSREIEFDGRQTVFAGGVDETANTITFLTNHNLQNAQEVIYKSNGNEGIGVGVGTDTLVNNGSYFVEVINNRTIKLYESALSAINRTNVVGLGVSNTAGTHKFSTLPNQKSVGAIEVIDGGTLTNRKLYVKPAGISTQYNKVIFENHGFGNGDIVEYTTAAGAGTSTPEPITGLTTTTGITTTANYYQVLKLDDHSFRLANAGIAGTDPINFDRGNFVKFDYSGQGFQVFKYPDISVSLKYTPVGFGTATQVVEEMILTPTVRGSIIDAYLYETGTGYGSTIINFEKKPTVSIQNGRNASLKPNVINGRVVSVDINYGGVDYYSTPDLNLVDETNAGSGAKLRPIITNNRITGVQVVSAGIGYSAASTKLTVVAAGDGANVDVNVRPLTIDMVQKYEENELFVESNDKLKYTVVGYGETYRTSFGEVGIGITVASKIIGWAYDGNPIYGPFGYSNPQDANSFATRITSGYTLDASAVEDRPSTTVFSEGFFVEDNKFDDSGDLDINNGRFAKTPEFPNGIYAYYATIKDSSNQNKPDFPYFIGNSFRSIPVDQVLSQDYDYATNNLLRNTFPYRVAEKDIDNDFIIETNEISNQKAIIESVTSGTIDELNVVTAGDNYSINEKLIFDETDSGGEGLSSKISSLKGKEIVDIQTTVTSFDNTILTWNPENVQVNILPQHSLVSRDDVVISGLSTVLTQVNGRYQIGIVTASTQLIAAVPTVGSLPSASELYVTSVPESLGVGNSITVGSETMQVLEIFPNEKIIKANRGISGVSHNVGSPVSIIPDSFTIPKVVPYFESKVNNIAYFNPIHQVGFGVTPGISHSSSFGFGSTTITRNIPTQTIFLPNHKFNNNDPVTISVPGGAAQISIANSSGTVSYNLPQEVFVTDRGKNYIGIRTGVGIGFSDVFFTGGGTDRDNYYISTKFEQVLAKTQKIISTVSISTAFNHNLSVGDEIDLTVRSSLAVGIGTSTGIKLKRNEVTGHLLVNPINFINTGINSITNEITLNEHGLKTGDKVFYDANTVATGLSTGSYFVFKVDDDIIKLCATSKDAYSNPPTTIDMIDTGGTSQSLSLINPSLFIVGNSDVVFDVVDPSLEGYDFKFYYDDQFKNEFVSTGFTGATEFTITGVGTVGFGTVATRTLNYDSMLPSKLYYNIEKSGFISTADTQVKNHSFINFADSLYNGKYDVVSTAATTFDILLRQVPERLSYTSSETSTLEYNTTSLTATGGVHKVGIDFSGFGYKRLPNFIGIGTLATGSGAYIIPASKSVGNANQVRIINEGFEYSSDKTLKPNAYISPLIIIENSNTIGVVTVTSGGDNYLDEPNVHIVHPDTRQRIESGLLRAELTGPSVGYVDVVVAPTGLPEKAVELFTVNNTNGIGIQTVASNNTGIFTCYITTPSAGYSPAPFTVGDEVFIENMVKVGTAGTGFNSVDMGYRFPKVIAYAPGTLDAVTIDASEFTTNCGTAVVDQGSLAVIINKYNYPTFSAYQFPSQFIIGEQLVSNQIVRDLYITSTETDAKNPDIIKVAGTYELSPGEIIVGKESGTVANIVSITENEGRFAVDYAAKKDIGWSDDVGKLNLDNQVLPDNDYYQNLSYTVKSSQEYSTLRSPVNGLLHTAGLKNFADTGISSTTALAAVGSTSQSLSILDLTGDERVDTLYNWTTAFDLEYNTTFGSNITRTGKASKFVEIENKRLSSYLLAKSNQVLIIDDINSQFSNLDGDPSEFLNLFKIDASSVNEFEGLFVRVTDIGQGDVQTADLVLLSNYGTESVLLQKQKLNDETSIGNFRVEETSLGDTYLRFIPLPDAYNTDYDIKVVRTQFNQQAGVGTFAVGFVNLSGSVGVATTVSSGITTTRIIGLSSEKYHSLHLQNHLLNETTNEQNYVELYVSHDGEHTYTSEYFVDTHSDVGMYSDQLMGEFTVGFSTDAGYGNELIVEYHNPSTDIIQLKSKIVGFGTTAVGVGTYRFLAPGQPAGSEQTALYQSDYSIGTGTTTVFSILNTDFNAVKSVIEVSAGSTRALHQVYTMHDGGDVYTQPSPFISVGSTSISDSLSGLGSFNGKYNGNQLQLEFIPDSAYASTEIQVASLNLCMYGPLDTLNEPLTEELEFGSGREMIKLFFYNAINGDRINRKNFTLTSGLTPIFAKSFDPATPEIFNPATGTFNIDNHFFRTGEELIYKPNSTFVGVGSTPIQYVDGGGGINSLTSPVFVIRDGSDSFQIATTKTLALAGTAVTFVGVGTGNAHEFHMALANTKAVITIDNLIQSPLAYNPIAFSLQNNTENIDGAGTLGIGTTATTFSVSGISSLGPDDIVRVDDEFMKIVNLGIGTDTDGPIVGVGTTSLLQVERSFVGSTPAAHANNATVQLYRGSYNIVGKEIHFTESPKGNPQVEKNANNLDFPTSSFTGRAFLRNDYSTNQIYDDITDQFTGLDTQFTLKVGGANTVGLGSTGGSGLLTISNIFQKPSAANNPDNNFEISEDTSAGISSIVFTGITSATGDVFIDPQDINQNQLPRGGMLVSLGSTPGLGYAVPVPAKAYVETDAAGSITSIVGFPTVASVKNPIAAADYDNVTGELEITTTYPTYFESGVIRQVKLVGLGFTCADDYDVTDATYDAGNGNLTLIIGANALGVGQSVGIATDSLTFTCSQDNYSSYHSYPRHGTDPIAGIATPIIERTTQSITINVGVGTDSLHRFVGVGTGAVLVRSGFSGITTSTYPKYPVGLTSYSEDYTIFNVDERDYTHQFVGTATSALYSGGDYKHEFVSAATNAINGSLTPDDADYDANTGQLVLNFPSNHGISPGGSVTIANASLTFKCSRDNFQTEHKYPRPSDPAFGQTLTATVPTAWSIYVNVGTSPARERDVTDATYIPSTGQVELTVGSGHGYEAATPLTATNAVYTQSTGRLVITSNGHGLVTGMRVQIKDHSLTYTCTKDGNATEHSYPRPNDPAHHKWLAVHAYTVNTFTVYVGAAAAEDQYAHTFVSAASDGILKMIGETVGLKTESLDWRCSQDNYATVHPYPRLGDPAGDGSVIGVTSVTTSTITLDVGKLPRYRFTTNVGVNSIPHRYLGRGYALPWYGDATYGSAYAGNISIGITDTPYEHKFVSAASSAIEIGGDYAHSFVSGSSDLANAIFSGGDYKHTFVRGATDSITKVTGGGKLTPIGAAYTGSTGVLQMTFASAHGITGGQQISFDNGALTFTCDRDNNNTEHAYPRASDPIAGVNTAVTVPTATTVELNVGSSPNVTTTIASPYAEYSPQTGIVTFFVSSHNFNAPTTHTIADAGYNPTTGYLDITVTGHGWQTGEYVKIAENSLRFTCALDNHATDHYYPRFDSADKDETGSQWLPIEQVGVNTFAVYVGLAGDINAGIHTFVSASQPITKSVDEVGIKTDSLAFTCGRDNNQSIHTYPRLGKDPLNRTYSKVVGIATTGATSFSVFVGVTTNSTLDVLDSSYEGGSGILKVVVGDAGMTAVAANNNRIGIKTESLVFTCAKDNFATLHPYPRSSDPVVGICTDAFNNDATSFEAFVGSSVGTGGVVNASIVEYNKHNFITAGVGSITANAGGPFTATTGTEYDPKSGILTVTTTTSHSFTQSGINTAKAGTTYNPTTGVVQIETVSAHGWSNGDLIKIEENSLTFTCAYDNNQTEHTYPRVGDPIHNKWIPISNASGSTFQIQSLKRAPSTNTSAHTFVSAAASGIQKANNTVGFVTGGLTFTCAKNNHLDLHPYPRPKKDPVHNAIVGVEQVFAANKFTVNVGKSPYGTGARLDFNVGAAGTNYINPSLVIPEPAYNDLGVIGVSRLGDGPTTDTGTGLLLNIGMGQRPRGDEHRFVSAGINSVTRSIGGTLTVNDAGYIPSTGILELSFTTNHGLSLANTITIADDSLTFTCGRDNFSSEHDYPRSTDPVSGQSIAIQEIVDTDTIKVFVGVTTFSDLSYGEVTQFRITRNGYGFRRGDKFTPVGLVTDSNLQEIITPAIFDAVDVRSDEFSAWQFGQFDYIDSIKNQQDGSKTRFELKYDGGLLAFESEDTPAFPEMNLSNALLIIVNGAIQEPGVAYEFDGGTSFIFKEPPRATDDVTIFFYRGTDGEDTVLISDIKESVKPGDLIELLKIQTDKEDQTNRTIEAIVDSDRIETSFYTGPGISSERKQFSWTRQKTDKIIGGRVISKARSITEPLIFPTAKIIRDLSSSESGQIFVDDASIFNYEGDLPTKPIGGFIVDNSIPEPRAASLTATINGSGQLSGFTIVDGGIGYVGASTNLSVGIPTAGIGVGIGTTATATATITNGVITGTTITNSGFGYTSSNAPKVIAPLPLYKTELVSNITSVQAVSGSITGIGTTTKAGSSTGLALMFNIRAATGLSNLADGRPINIFNTQIGTGVTSVYDSDSEVIGIGTEFLDNVYNISGNHGGYSGTETIIICNIKSDTVHAGLNTTGSWENNPAGNFSMGRLSGTIARNGANPIAIGVSGLTINSGLTTFPTIQRRLEGFRDSGAVDPTS